MIRAPRAAAVLAVLFLAAHLPFLPASLEDVDSINFALGIRDYDVAQHQPHPPGYPVYLLAAKAVSIVVRDEVLALALLSVVTGGAAVLALFALYRVLAERAGAPSSVGFAATVLAATAPLFWFTAARPLSDVPGLAAAIGAQAMIVRAQTVRALATAALLAGLGAGIRSQVVWLTAPLLLLQWARLPHAERWRAAVAATVAYGAGVAMWLVPLLVASGGPGAYWAALIDQGAEDFSGVVMLWTHPSPRLLAQSLYASYLLPWGVVLLGVVVMAWAAVGAAWLLRRRDRWRVVVTLVAAYAPYHAFNLLFQETATVRYVLPMVVPIAFLAAAGLGAAFSRATLSLSLAAAAAGLFVVASPLAGYARQEAPVFRALGDVRTTATPRDILAMHRRAAFDLRRPLRWLGDEAPRFARQLPSPPKHEWLELVNYWNAGGRAPVWFVADPLRSDLALVRGSAPRVYSWPFEEDAFLGGVRPDEVDVFRLDPPEWYLGEGWALTPETAGVAKEDGRGPGRAPIEGWLRRTAEPVILMIGGRNLSGPQGELRIAIDGRQIDLLTVPSGFFLRMYELPAGALSGGGDYARLELQATSEQIAIEQFDSRARGQLVFGYGEGWYEHEYQPATGRRWRWMSDRAVLDVRSRREPLVLRLAGEIEAAGSSRVTVRIADRLLFDGTLETPFETSVPIPAEALNDAGTSIELTTREWYVPAEQGWRAAPDPRRLGLKVLRLSLETAN